MNLAQQRLVDMEILEWKRELFGLSRSKRRGISENSNKFELNKYTSKRKVCIYKAGLRDSYFSIPLHKDFRKMIRFQ